jgi:hypothetical protein
MELPLIAGHLRDVREIMLARLTDLVDGSDKPTAQARRVPRADLHHARPEPLPAPHPGGRLRIDKAKINTEVNLDGKYLLRAAILICPPRTSRWAKSLIQIERGWRDLKSP